MSDELRGDLSAGEPPEAAAAGRVVREAPADTGSLRGSAAAALAADVGRRPRSPRPSFLGTRVLDDFPLAELVDYIDWSPFFMAWELKGKYPADLRRPEGRRGGPRAVRPRPDSCSTESSPASCCRPSGLRILAGRVRGRRHRGLRRRRRAARNWPRFHTLRQQWERKGQDEFRALADYVAPRDQRTARLPRRLRA